MVCGGGGWGRSEEGGGRGGEGRGRVGWSWRGGEKEKREKVEGGVRKDSGGCAASELSELSEGGVGEGGKCCAVRKSG